MRDRRGRRGGARDQGREGSADTSDLYLTLAICLFVVFFSFLFDYEII